MPDVIITVEKRSRFLNWDGYLERSVDTIAAETTLAIDAPSALKPTDVGPVTS